MAHATMDWEIMEEDGYDDVTSQRRERTPHADEGSHRQGRTISVDGGVPAEQLPSCSLWR